MVSTLGGFLAGAVAACMSVTFTNPIEVVKTRMQLQGELAASNNAPKIYRSLGQSLGLIWRTEGIRGLQRGLFPAYIYQTGLNGCRLGLYEPTRRELNTLAGIDPSVQNYPIGILTGVISGCAGAIVGSPFYLIKTRMQSYSPVNAGVGDQTHYTSVWNGLKSLFREGGVRGLFKGVSTACLRTGAGSSVQLPIYTYAKSAISKTGAVPDGVATYLLAGTASGFGVAVVMNPFDVLMTRMYNQKVAHYSGPLDCLVKTVRAEGPMALYKGFVAQGLRVGPHTVLTLTFMEQTMKAAAWIEGDRAPKLSS